MLATILGIAVPVGEALWKIIAGAIANANASKATALANLRAVLADGVGKCDAELALMDAADANVAQEIADGAPK